MKMLRLKNGNEEAEPLIQVSMMSLRMLFRDSPIAAYELVMLARDPNHRLLGNAGDKLRALSLLEPDNRMHDAMRNIVLSAVEGDGLDMTLDDPVIAEVTTP